jgi:hypothetical protein
MKITVNGKDFTDGLNPDSTLKPLEGKARLRWSELGRLGGLAPGRITSNMQISVTLPGEKPKPHVHGWSLIIVDGMIITVQP